MSHSKQSSSAYSGYSSREELVPKSPKTPPPQIPEKKKKKIKVVSPESGEAIYVSEKDVQKKRKPLEVKSLSLSPDSLVNVNDSINTSTAESSNPNLCEPKNDPHAVPPMKEAPVVFVDEGSGFKPKPPVTKAPVVREMTISNWDDNLESMAKILEQGREKLYEHIKGFHAGMCLVTILILPSYQSDFPNAFPVAPGINYTTSQIPEVFELGRAVGNVSFLVPLPAMLDIYGELTLSQFNKKFNTTFWKNTTWNNLYTYSKVRNVQYNQTDSFRFVGWYSEYAVNLNVVFQLLSTLCLLGALHQASPPASWFGEAVFRYRDPKHILRLVFILSMFICYFCTVLITPIDTGLHESTMTQGGRFGMQLWQFNQTALSDPLTQADLAYWRQMNWMRGFCGLLGWLCSFLSLEYQRQREEEKQEYKIIPV